MLEAFASALRRLGPVSEGAFAALAAKCAPRSFASGAHLLRAGDWATDSFFLVKGLVRELYVGEDGAEHTRSFVAEHQTTGSLLDLLSGKPAVTFIEALEPTQTLVFAYADFDALCAKHADLNHVARRNAEAVYVRKARREHEMLALSAADRHACWLAEHPGLDARVSRKHLASYLGISPEHLSRLRHPSARKSKR